MIMRITALLGLLVLTACLGGNTAPVENTTPSAPIGAIQKGDPADPTTVAHFESMVGDRVLFAVDEYSLTPAHQGVLDTQAAWLLQNPAFGIIIEGHADEQGTREYNLALGARRARAVQEYLQTRGVPVGRMTTRSWGKERPIEICSSESCYTQNRRAVTVLNAGVI